MNIPIVQPWHLLWNELEAQLTFPVSAKLEKELLNHLGSQLADRLENHLNILIIKCLNKEFK